MVARSRCRLAIQGVIHASSNGRHAAHRGDGQKQREEPGPRTPLLGHRERRLDQRGVRQERHERADVRDDVESVRGSTRMFLREPVLKHRRGRAEQEERQADRGGQHHQQARHDVRAVDGLERIVRRERQEGQRHDQQRQMSPHLPRAARARRQMCVRVACDECDLEEDQARAPDRRSAAKPRQQHLGDERLNEEEKDRSQEDREVKHAGSRPRRRVPPGLCRGSGS